MRNLGVGLICDASALCGSCNQVDDGEDAVDNDAINLSHVGRAAYDILSTRHGWYHHKLWNVTTGKPIGRLHQTPLDAWPRTTETEEPSTRGADDLPEGHDDWFPEKMYEIMCRTEIFCDIMSLGPPDGIFMEKFKAALKVIEENSRGKERPVTIRMMFGNIPAMPVNCRKVIRKLTEGISEDVNIQLWVGAWRKGVSWNHAKIIAVDGRYLHTGGHNLWDQHYLKQDPVHDLSLELEGRVTSDGHLFANGQWTFIEDSQSTFIGGCVDKLPDFLPMVTQTRVTVSEFPKGRVSVFPPMFDKSLVPRFERIEGNVPIITIGRYGALLSKNRPSDDAMLAMLVSAQKIVHLSLQDLGPVCIPGTKIPLPGCVWPKKYLSALACIIWLRGVDVEIVLSNPGSVPGGLKGTEACYGNGWTCVDVAAEIIKRIKKQFPEAEDEDLRKKVGENLRVSYIREEGGNSWNDGLTIGMHAKHFIVDDLCCYIGSQNLYICDLAEWGVVIDDPVETQRIMEEYWTPMWKYSYTPDDCDVQEVMDSLDVDRDGEISNAYVYYNEEERKQMEVAATHTGHCPTNDDCYGDDNDEDV